MEFLDQININQLRVFEAVFLTKSMTDAALKLHLTQSGVSQHIKNLEGQIGVKLFQRVGQKLIATPESRALFEQCHRSFQEIESSLSQIANVDQVVSGHLNIGVPNDIGHNLIIPILSDFLKKYPLVKVHTEIEFSDRLTKKVLNGDLDLAFVDDFYQDKKLNVMRVYNQKLQLVGTKKYLSKQDKFRNSKSYYEKLSYISYLPGEPVLREWFKHHLNESKVKLEVRASLTSPQGVVSMVLADLGVGVVPQHIISAHSRLEILNEKPKPLQLPINVVSLATTKQSGLFTVGMEFIKELLYKRERQGQK